jgi:hypothetical protein
VSLRLALGLVLLLSALFCSGQTAPADTAPLAPAKKVHVVVVGVTKFAIPDYNNDVLTLAFQERCKDVQSFFEGHLGTENVTVHSFCTPETTTRDALRHFFSIEVPQFSADTLTLIFIMSHGEEATFDNQFLSSDVEIITSDTKASDVVTDADKERQFSSILFGSELLSWLQRAPAGSTILTFVDTCHSGAIASLSTSFSQALQQHFGLGSLVMASSLKGDSTYSASFTKALLDLWGKDSCLDVDTMSDGIYEEMKTLAPITGTEGIPSIPVRYNGPLCLGNFGTDHHLLFIYAGQDAENNPYKYDVAESDAAGTRTVIDEKPLRSVYIPIPLDAKKYIVTVSRDPDLHQTFNVDLTAVGHQMIWLDTSASPDDVGKAGEVLAQAGQAAGLPPAEIAGIRQSTVAIYRAAGKDADAVRVLSAMQSEGQAVPILAGIQNVAFQTIETVKQALESLHVSNIVAAKQLQTVGDFKNAGVLLHAAADQEPDKVKQAELANKAYVFLGAAGDIKDAHALGKEYPKIDAAVGEKAAISKQSFQSKQMLNAIGALTVSPAGATAVGPAKQ